MNNAIKNEKRLTEEDAKQIIFIIDKLHSSRRFMAKMMTSLNIIDVICESGFELSKEGQIFLKDHFKEIKDNFAEQIDSIRM